MLIYYANINRFRSDVCNACAAKRAAILSTTNPLLDALSVEDVLLITVQRCHEVVAHEVTPADRALSPDTTLTLVESSFFLLRRLLVLELCLV